MLLLSTPLSALAAKITIVPFIQIRGEYNDNIAFSRTDKKDDYITTATPGVTFNYETELLNVRSNVSVDILRYLDETDRNTENQHFELDIGYLLQEKIRTSGSFSYPKDTTLESELTETGLVTVLADRQRYDAGGGLSYQLSELSDIGLNYMHREFKYDWSGNVDYDSDNLDFTYRRSFNNQLDVFTFRPYYSRTSSEASEVDTYGTSFGLRHIFTETLTFNSSLGGRYTKILYSLVQPEIISDPSLDPPFRVAFREVEQREKTWGWVVDISLIRTGETSSTTIGYNRDLSYSAFGEPTELDRIYCNTRKRLTERFGVGFSGSFSFTKSEGEFDDTDRRHFDLRPSLNYQLAEDHSLRLFYNYSHAYDKTLTENQKAERNRVWIILDSQFPKEW